MTASQSDVADLQVFTEALTNGQLLLRTCLKCGERHHYPRSYCPFCGSEDLEWFEASGRGSLYSFTRWRLGDKTIYPAMVSLEEGLLMTATLTVETPELAIGAQVRLAMSQPRAPEALFTLTIMNEGNVR